MALDMGGSGHAYLHRTSELFAHELNEVINADARPIDLEEDRVHVVWRGAVRTKCQISNLPQPRAHNIDLSDVRLRARLLLLDLSQHLEQGLGKVVRLHPPGHAQELVRPTANQVEAN